MSVTDACVDLDTTEALLDELAEASRTRRTIHAVPDGGRR